MHLLASNSLNSFSISTNQQQQNANKIKLVASSNKVHSLQQQLQIMASPLPTINFTLSEEGSRNENNNELTSKNILEYVFEYFLIIVFVLLINF